MRIRHGALPAIRLAVLIVFVTLCALIFAYLWVNAGGKVPPITKAGYQVSFTVSRVGNLVNYSDVMIAGVPVGKVESVEPREGQADVTIKLDQEYPLHKGAKVRIGNKTLVEESYVEIVDGQGGEIVNGSTLPADAVKPAVTVDDVLASLDDETRAALADSLRSLGAGTKGSRKDVSVALTGLGELGREGKSVFDALAEQSEDLKELSGNSAALLAALDTRRGQIADMVSNANALTAATASRSDQLKQVVRKLPGLLDAAREASGGLNMLSDSLRPVAANLNEAGPPLSRALTELPQTSADLRGMLPALDSVLSKSPDTLSRVPRLSEDVRRIIPNARVALCDVNPMLSYVRPYGREVAALFTNWNDSLNSGDSISRFWRVYLTLNEKSVGGSPLDTNKVEPLNKFNPYPPPGSLTEPGPYERPYPRIERECE